MKILFITPHIPSDKAGGAKFTKLLLEKLSQNHLIDLLYFRYSNESDYTPPNSNIRIIKVCPNSKKIKLFNTIQYPFIHPLFSVRFNRNILNFLKRKFNENQYDLFFLDHSQMALYGKFFPNTTKIYMSHDVMAQRYGRSSNAIIKALITSTEKKLMTQPNTLVFSFSEKDKDIIYKQYNINSYVTNFYLDNIILKAKPEQINKQIVFFGKWNRADNFIGLKWFIENVLSILPKNIKILIIGSELPKTFHTHIKDIPNIEYLGFVQNPYSIISNSLAVISPLFSGAGVKVKVIESLACGTPVIGNEIAFEGISKKYNNFMLYADKPEDYKNLICKLNIPLSKRNLFKEFFLENYQKQYISSFINNLESNVKA